MAKHPPEGSTEVEMSVSAVQEILNAEAEARKIKEEASAQAKKTIAAAHEKGEMLLSEAEKEAALTTVKTVESAEEKRPSAIDFIIKSI